jgi:hypothetical protein
MMAKMAATDTRVEKGMGTFEGQWFGYAKRDTTDDEEDQYDYRYDEFGPFKDKAAAQAAAERAFSQMRKSKK